MSSLANLTPARLIVLALIAGSLLLIVFALAFGGSGKKSAPLRGLEPTTIARASNCFGAHGMATTQTAVDGVDVLTVSAASGKPLVLRFFDNFGEARADPVAHASVANNASMSLRGSQLQPKVHAALVACMLTP